MEQSQQTKKPQRDEGGMAFPGFDYTRGHGPLREGPNGWEVFQPGMTLRDYFAAKAMQGMLAAPPGTQQADEAHANPSRCAAWAYEQADAMIAERAK